jgi:hypothetical protein
MAIIFTPERRKKCNNAILQANFYLVAILLVSQSHLTVSANEKTIFHPIGAQCKKSAQCREGIFNCAGKISKELKNNIKNFIQLYFYNCKS